MDNNAIITSKPQLKDWLSYELKRYGGGWRYKIFPVGERDILMRHQVLLRKTEYHFNCHHKLRYIFLKYKLAKVQNRYCLHIPLNVCGRGLKIMHIGPILINGKARLGQNCSLHINTSIVAGGRDNRAPTLGNHVVVGVGAVILGGISIANDVAIGANAVVNKDIVQENVAVAGVPAKIISTNGALTWNKRTE